MSIENISQKILGEAELQANEYKRIAEEEAKKILQEAKIEASEITKRSGMRIAKETAEIRNRKVSVANLEIRKMYLAVKQEGVTRSINKAVEDIAYMDRDQYIEVMVRGIIHTEFTKGELLLNKRDRDEIGEKVVKEINQKIKGGEFTLSEKTLNTSGGFVLKQGDVTINSTLEIMVNAIRRYITPSVVATLF